MGTDVRSHTRTEPCPSLYGQAGPLQNGQSVRRGVAHIAVNAQLWAEAFGQDAERYDRARPGYPSELIDELFVEHPGRVLDVGCGTGQAGRMFVSRGCAVVGVEPDPRMAAVAERHGLRVEIARFEDWQPVAGEFDLLVSGQAWHWIDPEVSFAKGAAAIRPRGRFAAFWNEYEYDEEVRRLFGRVYREIAPDLLIFSVFLGAGRIDYPTHATRIMNSGLFEQVSFQEYRWTRRYTRSEWLDELPTHSDHFRLGRERLSVLVGSLGPAIDDLGGDISVQYRTTLMSARTP